MENKIIFVINLLQDVNIIRPLAYYAFRKLNANIGFLITEDFGRRDKNGIWSEELEDIINNTHATYQIVNSSYGAYSYLNNFCGMIIAGSESSLSAHKPVHDLFKSAPSRFVKVTLQHGFECVGFLQSRDQDIAHGKEITFAADIICGWTSEEKLTSVTKSERHKLWITGPTALLEATNFSKNKTFHSPQYGLVCENMHSPRLNTVGDFKSEFLAIFDNFTSALDKNGKRIILRPHPGGQYVIKNNIVLKSNVEIENSPIYKMDLSKFSFAISAPSSILIDLILAGVPTAVWRDSTMKMDMGNYEGLTQISSLDDWLAFSEKSVSNPDFYIKKQNLFIQNSKLKNTYDYVSSAYGKLLCLNESDDFIRFNPLEKQKDRILFVASGYIPTLQLSFIKPLYNRIGLGQLDVDLISESHLNSDFNGRSSLVRPDGEMAKKWVIDRFKSFSPSIVVFCRYSGPHSDVLMSLCKEYNVSSIYHIDDDLLGIPKEIGESKHAFHNSDSRLDSVRFLLDSCDLIYASTYKLKSFLISKDIKTPIFAGEIYCSGSVINPPLNKPVQKIGYMASADHAHNLTQVLGAIVKLLRVYPTLQFEFFGSIPIPKELLEFGSRISHAPKIDNYDEFMNQFANYKWDVGICPLSPIHFNLMKANTKWVEYTSIGAAVVASKNTVYDECCDDGCGLLAESEDEWFDALNLLVSEPETRFSMVSKAQDKLVRRYSIKSLEKQVMDVFGKVKSPIL